MSGRVQYIETLDMHKCCEEEEGEEGRREGEGREGGRVGQVSEREVRDRREVCLITCTKILYALAA